MDFGPETATFLIFLLVGSAGAYFIGVAMNGVMQEDGFGVLFNAMILMAGGFLGYHISQYFRPPMSLVSFQAMMVVSGGFMCLALLAVMKNVLRRLGF